MIRIAVGGLMHESNTFAGAETDWHAFEAGGMETGAGLVARWGQAHHELAGFLEGAARFGFEAVPTFMAWATPAGPVAAEAFCDLVDRLVQAIDAAGPVDAVLLALHGAMVARGEVDADGTILARVREKIGTERRLVATLDYHGNVSPLMVAATDAILAYQTYPHVDQRPRGLHAAGLAAMAARGEVEPAQALAKPPVLIHLLAQDTEAQPMQSIIAEAAMLEARPEVLAANVLAGFPYADVPATGPACVVVTDDDWDLANRLAEGLGQRVWQHRHALSASLPSPAEAVRLALAAEETPVVLIDLGDNVGGGSAADSTVLMHELLRQGATGVVVVLFDPEAVCACVSAGVRHEVRVAAGGKIDQNAPPLGLEGRVRLLHDGRYVEHQVRHGGQRYNDQGVTAVVALPGENTVVLTSRRHPPFSLGQLTSLGLDPRQARVIVVKGAVAPKAAYGPVAGTMLAVDTPGLTAANPARFVYHNVRRPMFPIDSEPWGEGDQP